MNQIESVQLVGNLNRAGLLQALEGQAAVWADALSDIAFPDAVDVARALIRERTGAARWVCPGDIRVGVSMIRNERIRVASPISPPECIDPSDVRTEMAWRRELNAGQGAGMTNEEADALACRTLGLTRRDQIQAPRPVPQLVARVADAMPRIPRAHTIPTQRTGGTK